MIRWHGMFARSRRKAAALGCAWLTVLGGCVDPTGVPPPASGIPDFARPRPLTGDEAFLTGDVIPYRRLRRDDFRAPRPPPDLGANVEQMGAITCAAIKSLPGARFTLMRRGANVEVGTEGLEFEASMDRGCSWWNEAARVYSHDYVLEHEQVHLALFEVEARRLTRRVAEIRVSAPRETAPEELAERLQRRIDREVAVATETVLERSLRFDEATSGQPHSDLQRRWLDDVERELRQLPR